MKRRFRRMVYILIPVLLKKMARNLRFVFKQFSDLCIEFVNRKGNSWKEKDWNFTRKYFFLSFRIVLSSFRASDELLFFFVWDWELCVLCDGSRQMLSIFLFLLGHHNWVSWRQDLHSNNPESILGILRIWICGRCIIEWKSDLLKESCEI